MHSKVIEMLYQKYYQVAFLYTLSLCKNKDMAEDIVSQAFEKAMISLDDDKQNFKYWLLTVCKNLWIDTLRKHTRHTLEPLEEERMIPFESSILSNLIQTERQQRIYEHILQLPIKDQELLILHYYAELPLTQIAKILSITHGTAKTAISRARTKLKKRLEEDDYEF